MFGLMADSDYRVHTRRRPGDMKVLVDGVPCMLLDYSNGGVRISTTHFMRRVALVEVYRGRRLVKKSAAVVA